MYVDPNVGGVLFQALLVAFTFLTGTLLVFSGKIRSGIARMRRRMRKEDTESEETDSTQ